MFSRILTQNLSTPVLKPVLILQFLLIFRTFLVLSKYFNQRKFAWF